MDKVAVPLAAQKRLKQLYADYMLSKEYLLSFTTGLLLGMGLSPEDWELDTSTMTLTLQEEEKVGSNGTTHQWGGVPGS